MLKSEKFEVRVQKIQGVLQWNYFSFRFINVKRNVLLIVQHIKSVWGKVRCDSRSK